MKEFIKGLYDKPHLWKRIILCIIAVCIMGFCVSWLSLLAWGTDPCSVMNLAIARRLGTSFGNWQALFNVILFFVVIWKDKSNIGFGTLFNMFLVGYSCDLTTWMRERFIPDFTFQGMAVKAIAMAVILFLFVFSVAVYMSVELGTAPYDAMPFIIAKAQDRLSFRTVRIIWDCAVTVIGFLLGGTVGIVTVLMAFTIGPMAAYVEKHIRKYIS